jgi:hypothetical protein
MRRGRRPFQQNRPFSRPGIGPIPLALIEANRLYQIGDYAGAASLYEGAAERAKIARPRQVPRLLIEAGRARLLAGQIEDGLHLTERGLQVLVEQQRWADLHRLGSLVEGGLRLQGFIQQADELQRWIQQTLGQQSVSQPGSHVQRVSLPEKCPYCGGNLDPREVEWVSENTVECAYCASLIHSSEG